MPVVGIVVTHAEVGVVLYLLDAYTQHGVGLLIGESAFQPGPGLCREVVVVPPYMLAVIFGLEEARVVTMEIGLRRQAYRIAEEGEVDVGAEIEMQLADVIASDPGLCPSVEVQGAPLGLAEQSADGDVVLLPTAAGGEASYGVDHLKIAVLVGDKHFEACLHIFVESFQQSDAEDILQHAVVRHVVDGVIQFVCLVEIAVQIVFLGRGVCLVDMAVVVPFEGVEETGDGDELVFHGGIDGVLDGLGAHQTVERGLVFDLDAGGIDGLCRQGVEQGLRLCTHDTGVVRSAAGAPLGHLLLGRLLAVFKGLLGLALFLFFLRGLGKLSGLDLLVGHLHLAVESEVITVGEEQVLVVVTVPGI